MAPSDDWQLFRVAVPPERTSDQLDGCDEKSAARIARIARKERGHIAIARRFFP